MSKTTKIKLGYDIPRVISISLNGSSPAEAFESLTSIPVSKLPPEQKEVWVKFISSLKYDEKNDTIYFSTDKWSLFKSKFSQKKSENKNEANSETKEVKAEKEEKTSKTESSTKKPLKQIETSSKVKTTTKVVSTQPLSGRNPNNKHFLKD
ncbi:MAG: hypothetical protein ACRC4M_00390 [Mycoplasma sp.]